jgi:hypothetical protein
MKNLILCFALMSTIAHGQTIEEVIVVGQPINKVEVDPALNTSTIESILPSMVFTPGGIGGFSSFRDRGQSSTHTRVFRNGVPVNDPSTGWYDWANDLPQQYQEIMIAHGPNSVLTGSGSLAGTVFITDKLRKHFIAQAGSDSKYFSVGDKYFSIASKQASNGSVMNTNEEEDDYHSNVLRLQSGVLNYALTDYQYDYDSCWESDDCEQKGRKHELSIQGENATFGFVENEQTFLRNGEASYSSKNQRYYLDARKYVNDYVLLGSNVEREDNGAEKLTVGSVYSFLTYDLFNAGLRYENDDVFVYKVGVRTSDFSISVGNSYRRPTLYETNGDGWVSPNRFLNAEEGQGVDVRYKIFSAFAYEFDEGIDYDYVNNQYVNTGSYSTKGIKVLAYYKQFKTVIAVTHSDLPRIPKLRTAIMFEDDYKGYTYGFKLAYQNGRRDVDKTPLEDVKSAQLHIGKDFGIYNVMFQIRDVFDREFEILPQYTAGGREYLLTLALNY